MRSLIYILCSLIIGCNSEKIANYGPDPSGNNQSPVLKSGCYQMIIVRDTATLQLVLSDSLVTGTFRYKNFEKDSNSGNFKGILKDSLIIGWYTFSSEDQISVRQMIYQYTDGVIQEGYGDVEIKHDSVFFKYPQTLNFESRHPFIPIPCHNQ